MNTRTVPDTPVSLGMPFTAADEEADLSVIIVSYNTAHLIERCLTQLRIAARGLKLQLLIVDNASRDGSVAIIRSLVPDAQLLANDVNVGFARANNQVLPLIRGRYLLLLNADAYLLPDTLSRCLAHMAVNPRCGVLGVRSVDECGQPLFDGREFPTAWGMFKLGTGLFQHRARCEDVAAVTHYADAVECDWVVGCCYLVRRELVDTLGLFDPRFFLYFEEVDHCRSVRAAGWSVHCLLTAQVVHEGGGAAVSEGGLGAGRQISTYQTESSLLYYRKHGGLSGVLMAAGLAVAAEIIVALKRLLKPRGPGDMRMHLRQARHVLGLLVRTRLGTVPLR